MAEQNSSSRRPETKQVARYPGVRSNHERRVARFLTSAVLAIGFAWFSASGANESDGRVSDDSLRLRGVFDSVLPGTEAKNSLKLIVHPHVGDLSKRDHLRTDLGFSYGLTARWEIFAETRLYFGHGLDEVGLFSDAGFADYVLETKYRIGDSLLKGWDTAIELSYAAPLGHPAPDVTDGLIHRRITFSFARRLADRPHVRVFWGLSTDLVTVTDVVGELDKNDFSDSSQRISGGFVVDRGEIHYTMEAAYATTRLWGGGDEDLYSVRPGFVWKLPRRYTLNSRGQWLIGAAVPVTYGSEGTDVGVSIKLRMNFDFKRLIHRHSKSSAENP